MVAAQLPDLPLSKTALEAIAEVRQLIPRRLESIAAPLLDGLVENGALGLSEKWRTRCGKDELTGETLSCWLDSPDYVPAGWGADSSCHRRQATSIHECALATFRDATLGSQQLSVHCDGRVQTEMMFTVSRFMIGDEVVARDVRTFSDISDAILESGDTEDARRLSEELDATQTLFTSADGSWASKGVFAFEGVRFNESRKDVYRFVPDSRAIQEFLAGPHCAAEQRLATEENAR